MKKKKIFFTMFFLGIVTIYMYHTYVSSTPVKAVEAFRSQIFNDIVVVAYEKVDEGTLVYSAGHTKIENDNFYCVDLVKRSPITYKWVGGGGHNHRDIIKGIQSKSYILSAQVLNEKQGMGPIIFGIIKDKTITGLKFTGDFEGSYEAQIFKGLGDERIYAAKMNEAIAGARRYNILIKRKDGSSKDLLIMPRENYLEEFNDGKDVLYYRGEGIESYGLGIERSIAEKIGTEYDLDDKVDPSISHINGDKYLVSYFEEDIPLINPMFFIYDDYYEESIEVEHLNDYIEEIVSDGKDIILRSKGRNIFNGFKKFPVDFLLDCENGELIPEEVYKSLLSYEEKTVLGNWFNETKLNKIEMNENIAFFDFGISENSILAGGDFCPNVIIKPVKEGLLSVSIENLKYDEEMLREYSHSETEEKGDYGNYTEILIEFGAYDSYRVEFTVKDDGLMDMEIIFK